jgi:hypothetical protein
MIPEKDALSAVNQHLQDKYQISVTPTAIVDAMLPDEIPKDVKKLVSAIADFVRLKITH